MSEYQFFWRCDFYDSAIQNFFDRRELCSSCSDYPPRWHDNGFHQRPRIKPEMKYVRSL